MLSLSMPVAAGVTSARRPAARGAAAAHWAAPRASLAVGAPRAAKLASQRSALGGDSAAQLNGAVLRAKPFRRAVAAQPAQASLSAIPTTLMSGPLPAKGFQAAAIAAAYACVKLAWEARHGSNLLLMAAGYAVTAGAAHAIAAEGGKPGSDTLKRLNAGLVRSPTDIIARVHSPFPPAFRAARALGRAKRRC